MRASHTMLVLVVAAACAQGPQGITQRQRFAEEGRLLALASSVEALREDSVLAQRGRFRVVDAPVPPEPATAPVTRFDTPAAAFAVGASGRDDAADLVEKNLPADAAPDVVAAAAMGLGSCTSDATARVLVALALRPSQPPEAVEALFSFYRRPKAKDPAPATLPDERLLAYAKHPSARGRAALAHLGRAVKDPALINVLADLAVADPDFEVRRAAALGLAEAAPKHERSAEQRATCLTVLEHCLLDPDAHVIASACRAISSYDDPKSGALLLTQIVHSDFNVRVAALEGLGRRKAADAAEPMAKLACTDPSVSVRYAAATQLAEIDPKAARELVDSLLASASEYVRSAGVEILAKSDEPADVERLAHLTKTDLNVRVRETAVGGFEGKKDSAIAKAAIAAALLDRDPVVVATACGVAAKNGWDYSGTIAVILSRFDDCAGADARESALTALSDLDHAEPEVKATKTDRRVFELYTKDPNPAVRSAAFAALAKIDKKDPPPPVRGADLTGDLLPGGAAIFDKDVFLVVETDRGTMRIRLFPEQAPIHCAHVAALARAGRYDGLIWHRVVPDFVIQGGCPRGDGAGNAGVTLPLEPTRVAFERGTLGMPRSDHPDTGGCQLFICHSRAPHLDVRYTAFGQVVEGLDVIDRIDVDCRIVKVRVEGAR